MRQVICFLCALGLTGGGAYLLYMQLAHSHTVKGIVVVAAGAMMAAGGAWLYNDFLGPESSEDGGDGA